MLIFRETSYIHKIITRFIIASGFFFTPTAVSKSLEQKEWIAERLAIILTGKPANLQMKTSYVKGTISLDDYAESLRNTAGFEATLGKYWTEVLKINAPTNITTINDPNTSDANFKSNFIYLMRRVLLPEPELALPTSCSDIKTAEELDEIFTTFIANQIAVSPRKFELVTSTSKVDNKERVYRIRIANLQTIRQQIVEGATVGKIRTNSSTTPICTLSAAQQAAYQKIYANFKSVDDCDAADEILVKPLWSNSQIRVCKDLQATTYCGPSLGKCIPRVDIELSEDPKFTYLRDLGSSLSLEPGMLIAKIVKDDLDFAEVVTTTKSVINGTIMHFLKHYGRVFINVSPPGSYPGWQSHPLYANPNPSAVGNFQWIERGSLHAGILSTSGFQRATNGWRAKANRVMNALLCKQLTVPDGVVQTPSSESELTRIPYCQSCHVILEPFAQFFGRWPTLGKDSNFYYDPSFATAANGSYDGLSDADTAGLGRVLIQTEDYNVCAVRRAFEFVMRRPPTSKEEQELLPMLVADFKSSGRKVWPIMKALINTPLFGGGR